MAVNQESEHQLELWRDLRPIRTSLVGTRKASNDAVCSLNPFISSSERPVVAGGYDQLSLPYNLIYMDKGLHLAPNGRWVKHEWVVCDGGLVGSLVDEFQSWQGITHRFHRRKYLAGFSMLLANLLDVHHKRGQLLLLRSTSHRIDVRVNPERVSPVTLNRCCDFMVTQNLIAMQVGKSNDVDKVASWCIPLAPLIALLEQSKARIQLHSGVSLALVRKAKVPIPAYTNRNKALELKRLEKPVRNYTNTWLNHSATLAGNYVLPWVRRLFNNSMEYGGRWYGSYQQLPKVERRKILIDGERTVEPDYKAIHINLLYAREGLQFAGDPYLVDGYERSTIKTVCLQLVNIENLGAFKQGITKSGKPETKSLAASYADKVRVYNQQKALGFKANQPKKPKKLLGFIEGIPDGVKGDDLLNKLMERHKPIAHHFGTDRIGLILQRMDSEVLSNALERLHGIPCLPVHDSIRCKVSDSGIVIDAMKAAYKDVTGQNIIVKL